MIADEVSFAVPTCARRRAIGRSCPAAWLALVAASGCMDGGPTYRGTCPPDCMEYRDAGPGGARDASAPVDAGGKPPITSTEDGLNGFACFNGVDDDLDEATDCEDVACSRTPFCCLGVASPECCGSSGTLRADFAGCVDLGSCGASASVFGTPRPLLAFGALVPNGDAVSDSGIVLDRPLDGTRERIEVTASIASPDDGCTECLDAVGIGVGDGVSGDVVLVRADAAVLVRAARRDYALLVAGEVVMTRALEDGEPHEYALALSPDGSVTVSVDGEETMEASWSPRADRRAIVDGRTANRPAGSPPPARAVWVELAAAECEIPSALAREPAALMPSWSPIGARAPSAVPEGDGALVAFEIEGAIHLARTDASGVWSLAGSGDVQIPALDPPDGEAYRDPELVDGGDHWVLYVTHEHDGTRSIARALGAGVHAETFDPPIDLIAPVPVWSPSVEAFGGRTVVAAVYGSEPRIGLFELAGDELVPRSADLSPLAVVSPRGGVSAFDADEVAAPALFVDGSGLLRLYYSGRRGSRWSIGMIASGDGTSFGYAPSEPVLRPSGSGHDALSVLDPSVVELGGDLHLFHTASDGLRPQVSRAIGGTRW